jgi:hypothetical protein
MDQQKIKKKKKKREIRFQRKFPLPNTKREEKIGFVCP